MTDSDQPKNKYRNQNYCPYCNHSTDAAFIPEDETQKPVPGNLNICIQCAKPSVFTEDMKLDKFDMTTLDKDDHAHIVKMQYTIHGVNGRYSSKH